MDQDEILINDESVIYCLYTEDKNILYFLGFILTEGNRITNYAVESHMTLNMNGNRCLYELNNNDTVKDFNVWTKIFNTAFKPDIINYVKIPKDYENNVYEFCKESLTKKEIDENIKHCISKTIKNGNGLKYNTNKSIFYLLQRIITLEKY